jgi:hypothetical protein
MTYEDKILVALADPNARAGVFDATGLAQLVSAAYDTDSMSIEGPYTPVFDEVKIGMALPRLAEVEGNWGPIGGVAPTEARFQLLGLGPDAAVRVDAFWRGSVVARTAMANGQIVSVSSNWPNVEAIDGEIVAALGALPADPAALETARRQRFIAKIQAAFAQPTILTDDRFDDWLKSTGATSVSDLLTNYRGVLHTGSLQVAISQPALPATAPKALPIAAAVMIRDTGFSVAQLVTDSKTARQRLEPLALGRPGDASLKILNSLLVIWIVPATIFDDNDWPGGATRDLRRAAAGAWLAREGIGLVATN